jgi:hypothetical protein
MATWAGAAWCGHPEAATLRQPVVLRRRSCPQLRPFVRARPATAAQQHRSWPRRSVLSATAGEEPPTAPDGPRPAPPPPASPLLPTQPSQLSQQLPLTAYDAAELLYGGPCACCGGWHALPATPEALAAAAQLATDLQHHARIDFHDPLPDPALHIDYVWTKGPGRMFGVLTGTDAHGAAVVLKAFSGQLTNRWDGARPARPIASEAGPGALVLPARQRSCAGSFAGSLRSRTWGSTLWCSALTAASAWARAVRSTKLLVGPYKGRRHTAPGAQLAGLPPGVPAASALPSCSLQPSCSELLAASPARRWHVRGWAGPVAGLTHESPVYNTYRALTVSQP